MVRRWLVMALLVSSSSARADDEMPNAAPIVRYKPWAAAISYGVTGMQARTDGAERVPLAFFEMALRYRVITELGASFGGSFSRTNEDSTHLVIRGGVGLERRFKQWAFSLDVEACRVSEDATAAARDMEERYGVWAASLAMAALYYWGSGGPSLRHHGVP